MMASFALGLESKGRIGMHVRLTENDIPVLAEEYLNLPFKRGVSNREADEQIERIFQAVRSKRQMTAQDLQETAYWKCRGNRLASRLAENDPEDVKEITRVSFACTSERLRIGALLALHGVDWSMASVILHFAIPGSYPILDVRVMRTIDGPRTYTFDRWIRVMDFCRDQTVKFGVTMRELDRALWTHDYKLSGEG